jgi:hypothetical protein
VQARIAKDVSIALLDMVLPSGRTLAASTREELLYAGGWLVDVAGRLAPMQTVAEAGLTEDDLRSLYQA